MSERSTQISTVLLLSTGGTISSRRSEHGGLVATDGAQELFSGFTGGFTDASGQPVEIRALDIMRIGSYLLRPTDMLEIARRISRELAAADDVRGAVVTHGTDTMEETAFLADLVHARSAPVVFTGAQRSADAPDSDGTRNVADAVAVAASGAARDLGVLIVFDGLIFAAAGTRKSQTLASAAFASGSGPIGRVYEGAVVIDTAPRRFDPIPLDSLELSRVQVDIVPFYPGASTTALRAVAAEGATGIVLEATGAGNANPDFCREVAKLTASGVVVALSTRVASGPVTAIYGAGGGIDLVKVGAVPVGTLRSPQARMLLIGLLGASPDPESARRELRRRCGGS